MIREITKPTALASANGDLAPDAAGYSRRPLHTSDNVPHGLYYLWRTKKWDYWEVTSAEVVLGLVVADVDYANLVSIYLHDRTTGETIEEENVAILKGRGVELPTSLPPFNVLGSGGGITLGFEDAEDGKSTIIRVNSPRVSAEITVDTTSELLSVAVPWGPTRYFYTIKAPSLPAQGTVTIDGKTTHTFKDAWAVLDRGRGRWNYSNAWNWAAAGGINSEGRQVGFTVGENADVDGETENAFIVDKVLQEPSLPQITWTYDLKDPMKPWSLKADWIDATITPWHVRNNATQMLVVSSWTVQVFGEWSGWAVLKDGTRVSLDGLTGFAEEAYQRF